MKTCLNEKHSGHHQASHSYKEYDSTIGISSSYLKGTIFHIFYSCILCRNMCSLHPCIGGDWNVLSEYIGWTCT